MENYNKPVKVEFPKTMEVTSTDLDAVKKSTETISKIVSTHLIDIAKGVEPLKDLSNLFSSLKDTVVKQFGNLFQVQTETNIMNRQANIKVLEKKLGSVDIHITRKEEQLEKTNSQITNRFSGISKEMTGEHELFLKKLDSHVYTLVDQIYPLQIKERFSYDVQPNLDYLINHTVESAYVRTKCISDSFSDAKRAVSNFVEDRKIFYGDLAEQGYDINLDEGNYSIPIDFIEVYNNETNETEILPLLPWENDSSIAEDSRSILNEMIEEKVQEGADSVLNKDDSAVLIDWMLNHGIPKDEIDRFKNDCIELNLEAK